MTRHAAPITALLLLFAGCGEDTSTPAVEAAPPPPAAEQGEEAGVSFGSSAEFIRMYESGGAVLGSLTGGSSSGSKRSQPGKASSGSRSSGGAAGSTSTGLKGRSRSGPSAGAAPLSFSTVKSIINRNTPRVRACYEKQLKENPDIQGKVVVAWTIRATGASSGARVVRNTTGNRTMQSCITRAVGQFRFPESAASFDIEYPFVFRLDN